MNLILMQTTLQLISRRLNVAQRKFSRKDDGHKWRRQGSKVGICLTRLAILLSTNVSGDLSWTD